MPTKTSNQSGNWGDTSTWVGGVLPIDGDDIVIAAGHSVKMNVDQSAWTGLFSVVIQGSDTTPGMLYWMNGTNGYLKIRTPYTISGTTGTNKGRILINSDGVWGNTGSLSSANTAYIDLQTSAYIDATNLSINVRAYIASVPYITAYGAMKVISSIDTATDVFTSAAHGMSDFSLVRLHTTGTFPDGTDEGPYYISSATTNTFKLNRLDQVSVNVTSSGTGTVSVLTAHTNTGTPTANVLEDISANADWSTTAGKNMVAFCNHLAGVQDVFRNTLASKTATTVTFGANISASKVASSRIYISWRNAGIRSNTTSSSHSLIRNGTGIYFSGDARSNSTTSTYYGQLLWNCTYSTFAGLALGLSDIFSAGSNNTVSSDAVVLSTHYVLNSSHNSTVSGGIFSANNKICTSSAGVTITGGSAYAAIALLSGGSGSTISGFYAYGMGAVLQSCQDIIDSGSYRACTVYLDGVTRLFSLATFTNCSGNTFQNAIIDCVLSGSYTYLRYIAPWNMTVLYKNAILQYGSIISRDMHGMYGKIRIENENRVAGANRIVAAYGDIVETSCDGTSGAPSIDPLAGNGKCLKINTASLCATANRLYLVEHHRIWASAGNHTISYYFQSLYNIAAGDIVMVVTYETASVTYTRYVLSTGTINTRSSDTDWTQKITSASLNINSNGFYDVSVYLANYNASTLYMWPTPELT